MHLLNIRSIVSLLIIAGMVSVTGGCKRERLYGYRPPNYFPVTRDDLHTVKAFDSGKVWTAGSFSGLYHSGDKGASWKAQKSGTDDLAQLCEMDFIDEQHGWVVGSFGIILYTEDGGKTWTSQDSKTGNLLLNIDFVDEKHGWVVGEKSTLLRTRDGGASWDLQSDERGSVYNSVCFLNTQTGWIVGDYGTILHTTDGGDNWEKQECKDIIPVLEEDEWWAAVPSLFDVTFVDANKGLICGIDGIILITEDGGANWKKVPTDTRLAIYAITIKGTKAWAVGEKGNYLVSSDAGYNWKQVTGLIKTRKWLRNISFSSDKNGWVVGGMGTVMKTADGGDSWEMVSGQSYDIRSVWD
jgi:photosystem II stability/assembly factor-like uncharacterized protein